MSWSPGKEILCPYAHHHACNWLCIADILGHRYCNWLTGMTSGAGGHPLPSPSSQCTCSSFQLWWYGISEELVGGGEVNHEGAEWEHFKDLHPFKTRSFSLLKYWNESWVLSDACRWSILQAILGTSQNKSSNMMCYKKGKRTCIVRTLFVALTLFDSYIRVFIYNLIQSDWIQIWFFCCFSFYFSCFLLISDPDQYLGALFSRFSSRYRCFDV